MNSKIKIIVVGSLAVITALLLSACGVVAAPSAPAYGQGVPGGMMGGGMMGNGNWMMGGGMMNGGYGQSAPTAEPTPVGATPIPVDEEIQITATNLRFAPTQITVKPGETVRFVVINNDPFLHNFVSQEARIPFLNLPGNTTQTVTWTAPTTKTTYTALCTLHPGMSLTIAVKD